MSAPAAVPREPRPGPVAVEELRSEAALVALAPQWSELLAASSARGSLFLTPEWLVPWWRSFGRALAAPLQAQLWVLALRRGGRLCGLAPFVIETELSAALPVRVVRFLGHTVSDYLDLVLRAEAEPETLLERLVEHLAASRDWDVLDLRECDARSHWLEPLAQRLRERGWSVRVQPDSACHSIPIVGSWDEHYRSCFDRHSRKDHRREWRLLEAQGELSVQVTSSPLLEPGFLEELAGVEREHPQAGAQRPGVLNAEPARSFLVEALAGLDERGWLSCARLRVQGRVAAYYLGFRYGGGHAVYATAYCAGLGRWAVGKLLLMRLLESLWVEGGSEIDLLRGDQPFKLQWTHAHRRNARLLAVGGSPAARARGWLWLDLLPRLERDHPRLHAGLRLAGRSGWPAAAGRAVSVLCRGERPAPREEGV